MKSFITILFLAIASTGYGQKTKPIDTVTLCYNKYKVPADCKAKSESEIEGKNFSVEWLYMNEDLVESMPDDYENEISSTAKKFNKESINCFLLDTEVKGYKISFKGEKGMVYKIMAYGIVKEQPVIVTVTLNKEPKTNKDIPPFCLQFLKLTKEKAKGKK